MFRTAARLYADAFTADPSLADALTTDGIRRATLEDQLSNRLEVLNSDGRLLAARCAALAASGIGTDAMRPTDDQQKRLREQALNWLRADLAASSALATSGAPEARSLIRETLTLWLNDADLLRLRDPDTLKDLPAEERRDWNVFWDDVRLTLREAR